MDQETIQTIRRKYRKYLLYEGFEDFQKRAAESPAAWNIPALLKLKRSQEETVKELNKLAETGELVVGAALMRNPVLDTPGGVAPALVIGTFDCTKRGILALWNATHRLPQLAKEDPAVRKLYEDQGFQSGRRRPCPASVQADLGIEIFDVLLESGDFVEKKDLAPFPLVTLLAMKSVVGTFASLRSSLAQFSLGELERQEASTLEIAAPAPYVPEPEPEPLAQAPEPEPELEPEPEVIFFTAGDGARPDEVSDHIARHFGDGILVLQDDAIDIHLVPPTEERPYYYLITSGMSRQAMPAPEALDDCARAELCLALPPDWDLSAEALADDRHFWPVRWLKLLARYPLESGAWLWHGHSMPNGNPPEPIADTGFAGMVLGEPMLCPDSFVNLELSGGGTVTFLSPVFVYEEEMELKLQHGHEPLFDLYYAKYNEYVLKDRLNVAVEVSG